jgi:hypothetical protein
MQFTALLPESELSLGLWGHTRALSLSRIASYCAASHCSPSLLLASGLLYCSHLAFSAARI